MNATQNMTTLNQEHSRDACYFGERGDWLIAYAVNRDSDTVRRSNWDAFVSILGGESETVAIERSSHFLCGWVDYLVIDPADVAKVKLAEETLERLEDYPLLDEEAHSRMEWDEYQEAWNDYGASDFVRSLRQTFGLSDVAAELLEEWDGLQEFYESLIISGEYYIPKGSGVSLNIEYAVDRATRESIAMALKQARN